MLKRGLKSGRAHEDGRGLRHQGLPDARGAAAPHPGTSCAPRSRSIRHLHRGRPLPAVPLRARAHLRRPPRGRAGPPHRLLREEPRRHRHLRAVRPEVAGHHRADRLDRPLDHRRGRRRERPARLPLRRRAEHREPRPDGVHRDAEVRREVPLHAADALAGAEHQDRPLRDDLRRRGHRLAHERERVRRRSSGNKKSEALQDRIILVKVPYNLRVSRGGADLREAAQPVRDPAQRPHRAEHPARRQHVRRPDAARRAEDAPTSMSSRS